MVEPIKVGVRAPAFKLFDSKGSHISLSDFFGRKNLVIVFYCRNNTPG